MLAVIVEKMLYLKIIRYALNASMGVLKMANKKMGRPLLGQEPKGKMIYCRISEKEFNALEKVAANRGVKLSALFREAVEKQFLNNNDLSYLLDQVEPEKVVVKSRQMGYTAKMESEAPQPRKAFVDFEDLKPVKMADGTVIAPRSLKAKRVGTGAKW